MTSRLGTHLLRRLRHRLEREALDRAVEAEILIAGTWDVDGAQIRGYTAHPAMLQKPPREIERLVARLGSREVPPRSGIPSMTFGEDTFIVAEGGTRPLHKRKGKGADTEKGPSVRGSDARYRRLTARLLRHVRRSAHRPNAAEVATLLLLSRAVSESGVPLTEILRVLRTPRPIITMTASVTGFEGAFLDLIAGGHVLSGKADFASGYELSGRTVGFSSRSTGRWRVVTFPGIKYDPDEPEAMDEQVGRAAMMAYPILGVAETGERLPQRLRCATHLKLATGPLDMALIRQVLAAVLGEEPLDILPDESCTMLTLFDLAVAIRPGVTVGHAIRVLGEIAATKGTVIGAGEGKPGGRDSREETVFRKRTGRGDPGSGSDIIQPVPLTGGYGDRFIARVETLTGYGEAAEWAIALKADLDLWRAGKLPWEEMSTKLLLSGPPGTGKTTFARALCNSLQVPLVVNSVSTWLEPGYLGDVLKRMAAAFTEAERMSPAILFIDELDGIGTRRQRGEWADYGNSIVNRGLELLDGATRSSGVILVAATNHPEMIDPALLRSGRIERHIDIPPPDTAALVGILRYHLKDDIEAVVASAPPELTEAVATGRADAVLPEAAAGNDADKPAPTDREGTAGNDAMDEPPDAIGGFCDPAAATTSRVGMRQSGSRAQEDASHGEV